MKMPKGVEILPHTADIKLKVTGESLPELFLTGLASMNRLLKPGFCEEEQEVSRVEKVELEAPDSTVLLIDFLSEVLTLGSLNRSIFCDCSFESISDHNLVALLEGRSVNEVDLDIKAVTYHEADIVLNDQGNFETIIVFDV